MLSSSLPSSLGRGAAATACCLLLLLLPLLTTAWPSQMGRYNPRIRPLSAEEQQRIRSLDPPVMHDGRFHVAEQAPIHGCPPALVPNVFPAEKIAFAAATSFCSDLLAPKTVWHTTTYTPTAYAIRGTVLTLPPPEPTVDAESNNVRLHVLGFTGPQVTSACGCLAGGVAADAVATRTRTVTAAVKTIRPAA